MLRRGHDVIDSELIVINSLVDTLQRCEDDVCHLLTRLQNSLRADKRALVERSAELEAEKWPINWLPNELLIHIFVEISESTEPDVDADELFHIPPVLLSHVCKRWRKVCLTTSRLWSRISYRSTKLRQAALLAFLERSNNNALELVLKSPRRFLQDPDDAASYVLGILRPHISRMQSILFQCHGTIAMQEIVDIINTPTCDLSHLKSLTLQIVGDRPSFSKTPSLLGFNNSRREGHLKTVNCSPTYNSSLRELCLKQVPLFNVPLSLLPSVLSLELYYPPKKISSAESRSEYVLRMSGLRQFLDLVPQLTGLVLSDTVPFFDILPNLDSDPDSVDFEPGEISGIFSQSVELLYLRTLEWSYPYPADVHRFLAYVSTPSLEILDLYLDDLSLNRPDTALIRGYDSTYAVRDDTIFPHVIQLGSLVELSVQCVDDDALTLVLRRLALPVLEKVAFANVDIRRRKRDSLAQFPRLESIFRDPRMPCLTHLTLSHFNLDPEYSRSMLGYMPALSLLSLDTCLGAREILGALAETSTMSRRLAVKFCPRLHSLSLLGCDIQAKGLRKVVQARNSRESLGKDGQTGLILVSNTRPIKKLRRPGVSRLASKPVRPSAVPGTTIVFSMDEALCPAPIIYICVEECGSITEEDVLSLRSLGVEDVMWSDGT